jgi:pimeloyl-ACP methyl ester carboxylesterase
VATVQTSPRLNGCGDRSQPLIQALERNVATQWTELLENLEGADLKPEQSKLAGEVIHDGLIIATNVLTALNGTSEDAAHTPDGSVLMQYWRSLAAEKKRLASWRTTAGKKPLAPVRRALDLYEEQLLSLARLKDIVDCLENSNGHAPALPVVVAAESSARVSDKVADEDAEHFVLLVHGIRTEGAWQERVGNAITRTGVAVAHPFRYGYFDLIQFLTPGTLTRHKPIDRLHQEIRDIGRRFPKAKLTVVAHSFGTYAICRLLQDYPDIVLHRLVLCGSVVPMTYPWLRVREQVQNRVINECGATDIWPRLAAVVTWGYGATGATGFGTTGVRDRFHAGKHSDFFHEKFVAEFWLPFILYGHIPNSDFEQSRSPSPTWHRFVSSLPIRWFLAAAAITGFALTAGWTLVGIRAWLGLPWSFLWHSSPV